MIRTIKIFILITIALFFTLVAFDNVMDYPANQQLVIHVLSMDTTFKDPQIMKHAVTDARVQQWAYNLIIGWEAFTALIIWLGIGILIKHRKLPSFNTAKKIGVLGLFLGFLLYMLGFIEIGGEWFAMWQSTARNGQATAGMFVSFILLTMIFLVIEDK